MKCPLCEGRMQKGVTTLTFDKAAEETIVIKEVPGLICEQCGEVFIDIKTTRVVENIVKNAEKNGVKMGFLAYQPAA